VRLAALLGLPVVDRGGRRLGSVHDVRLVQDGPELGGLGAAFTVHSLVVGAASVGTRLGLERKDVKGPWPLVAAMRRLHEGRVFVHWTELWSIEQDRIRIARTVPPGEIHVGPDHGPPPGRMLDAGLALLDRQLVDADGRLAGNVDDLELTFPHEPGGTPIASAILAGPGSLAHRIGGRPGAWIDAVQQRLRADDAPPPRISFGVVKSIGSDVRLSVGREDLGVMWFEDWARRIVERLPGA
jgi:sporulation protein YlmC with PRC-barrel domain